MDYTVKELAGMSGVSVRTLHHYDAAGLLKPAYRGANGYRFYQEAQLLTLQQILFYRELGFELKQIQRILGRGDFDRVAALESHRLVLRRELARTRKLIATIDKTIAHMKGTRHMKGQELFEGFSPEQQARHEQYLIDRFGEGMREGVAASKQKVKHWTKADWEKAKQAAAEIGRDLARLMDRRRTVGSREVQSVVRRHHEWIKQFWTPTRESYIGLGQLILDSELRKAYAAHDPRIPEFLAAGMKVFAERELG